MPDYEEQRRQMVENQLKPRDIHAPRVLEAMGTVPREKFMRPDARRRAYADGAQPIGDGQTISQPYMVALMTQELAVGPEDRVLEIGTGSGYQCAVLAELAAEVYTVERIESLSREARQVLEEELGYDNISFRVGDGTLGWEEQAPFDRILVTAGAPDRPDVLLEQLDEHGLLVAPVGSGFGQMLTRYRKEEDGSISSEDLCRCMFVKLIGEDAW
jgi:protein-L-isoaspartate(D-aspartate) O-methyltransferase